MNTTASSPALSTIGAVERETGLLKDTLRVWERRYGFPAPIRDEAGERLYPRDQVDRLRLICRLMDQGWRPGKLLALPADELDALIAADRTRRAPTLLSGELVAALRAHDVEALRRGFQAALLEKGLKGLITDLIAPLNVDIGEAWLRGELGVPDEHFYTEQLQTFLRGALASYPRPGRPPRVLLTTLPEEEHGLGLLMAEVMLSAEGAHCCSLGPRMPVTDIVRAAQTASADVVALSFSAAFPARQALDGLRTLRATLRAQLGALVADVEAHFPAGTRMAEPEGGYFLWLELPESCDTLALHREALARGISIAPGPMFSARREFRNFMRLNFGHPDTEAMAAAITALGGLISC